MKVIALDYFNSFKNKCQEKILLFNKEIKSNVKKTTNLKKEQPYLNLCLNKINNENYLIQCSNFLKNSFLNKNIFNELTTDFYKKIVSEDQFTENYLLFYKTILENYYDYHKYDFSYLINLVESKFIIDFENKKVLLNDIINKCCPVPDDVSEKEKNNYLESYKNNNLRIIFYMIKNNILDSKLKKEIYDILEKNKYYENLLYFIKLNEDLEKLLSLNINDFSLRLKTIYNDLKNTFVNKTTNKNNCKEPIKTNKIKVSNKLLIKNIIEEYLFMEDIDEVKIFIDNYILNKNLQVKFVETVLLYGKENDKEKEMKSLLEQVQSNLKKKPVNIQSL